MLIWGRIAVFGCAGGARKEHEIGGTADNDRGEKPHNYGTGLAHDLVEELDDWVVVEKRHYRDRLTRLCYVRVVRSDG